MDDDRLAQVAKALAHPARIHIVRLLAAQKECRGSDVFSDLPLAQSTISQHLAVLKEAGVVSARAEGVQMAYCLTPGAFDELLAAVTGFASSCVSCSTDGEAC